MILPVPADRIRALAGGESLRFGARQFDVRDTPGHAVHHVSYFDPADGTAYVGGTGGIHLPVARHPPCLPASRLRPRGMAREHRRDRRVVAAPPLLDPLRLQRLARPPPGRPPHRLLDWTATARALIAAPRTDAERADRFAAQVRASLAGKVAPDAIGVVAAFSDFRASFHGIARYWARKDADTPLVTRPPVA